MAALNRIAQIAINVQDLKRATAFYRDVLGLRLLFEVPNLAFFDCGGVRLMLGRAERPEFDHPGSILYYQVGDIKAAHTELSRKGVKFEDAPHVVAPLGANDLWMTFCHDSEGNLLALTSEVPRGH
ncbi:MAG TPA: VOC family protein [Gemmatimonadales bacterium]|jgi:catechol 2,3-dioxygenase-like lactoylglutathione lyase family enzyme|nr:VOC family protein [Gemmatimonadales bacterium]